MSFKEGDKVVIVKGNCRGEAGTLTNDICVNAITYWRLERTDSKGARPAGPPYIVPYIHEEDIKKIEDLTELEKLIYNCQ